ncbi:response regulator receiver protein [Candidatus Koribacter versatilis Ellin345]|uniref:Response regulator receiver protein n=1 Tax=Koribacter versatilis (strain Ellin345) TaxID=204669 RepID=Q1IPG6_KORVE|nr:response regulator [Candidatus Koribacter versatilis]ABF41234.1 response regulator receiver protein [Candidatus Koribacter versatilis Ellin345]
MNKPKVSKPKVLLVEDSKFFLKATTVVFEREGFEVLTAATGEEALSVAQSKKPDIILLDLMLPRLDGMMVLRMLRGIPALKDTPVIVLSGNNSEQDRSQAKKLGAVDYFQKESTPAAELVKLVRNAIIIKK